MSPALSLTAEKAIGLGTTFLGAAIGSSVPLCFQNSARGLGLADAFAGGVFLSVALVHMLSESTEDLNEALPALEAFPLGSTLALVGFLFTLICGKLLVSEQAVISHLHGGKQATPHALPVSRPIRHGSVGDPFDAESSSEQHVPCNDSVNGACKPQPKTHYPGRAKGDHARTLPERSVHADHDGLEEKTPLLHDAGHGDQHSRRMSYHVVASADHCATHEIQYNSRAFGAGIEAGLSLNRHVHPDECAIDLDFDGIHKPSYLPYVLLLILSVHSFLAGLALGTSDSTDSAIGIVVAIVCHKGSAAMALGVTLVKNGVPRRRYIGLMSLFSMVTPLGVGVGMLVYSQLHGTRAIQTVSGVIGALSAGSFLYIATMHILEDVFSAVNDKLPKTVLFLFGMAVMVVVKAVAG